MSLHVLPPDTLAYISTFFEFSDISTMPQISNVLKKAVSWVTLERERVQWLEAGAHYVTKVAKPPLSQSLQFWCKRVQFTPGNTLQVNIVKRKLTLPPSFQPKRHRLARTNDTDLKVGDSRLEVYVDRKGVEVARWQREFIIRADQESPDPILQPSDEPSRKLLDGAFVSLYDALEGSMAVEKKRKRNDKRYDKRYSMKR